MKRIDEMFNVHRAQSEIFSLYKPGDIPYVGNGLSDNAVMGLVKPLPGDRVFEFRGVALSAFCEATVQSPPFIGCGRAGNGIIVLEPQTPMSAAQLACTASYINLAVRWRFSWYWQTTATRIARLMIPDKFPEGIKFDVRTALPEMGASTDNGYKLALSQSCQVRRMLGSAFSFGWVQTVGWKPVARHGR